MLFLCPISTSPSKSVTLSTVIVSLPSLVDAPASSEVNHSLAHPLTCFVFQCQFAVDGGIAILCVFRWWIERENLAGIKFGLPLCSEFSRILSLRLVGLAKSSLPVQIICALFLNFMIYATCSLYSSLLPTTTGDRLWHPKAPKRTSIVKLVMESVFSALVRLHFLQNRHPVSLMTEYR